MSKNHPISMADSFEKIPTQIYDSAKKASLAVAKEIAEIIQKKEKENKPCVLGLATGSTPKYVYAELVRMHREEKLSFKHVVTFNLDEYYPIERSAPQSYYSFMHKHLFSHVDIKPSNINMLDGEVSKEDLKKHCQAYEKKIEEVGGIDLQILGIGSNGHIAFNEPGSSLFSKTRLITLDTSTRLANGFEFANISEVPRLAITMGISSIMRAKKIILMAWGKNKAPVIQKSVEGSPTELIPASLLQNHDDARFYIDEQAASELTRNKSPWLTGDYEWTPKMIKKAVINMALKVNKPILSLTNTDYNEYGLSDLLAEKGNAYDINLQVFYMLRDSITGWPAGKQAQFGSDRRPERNEPYPKRVVIFSPHPDDDIISMGGTFMRLVDQGHEVHVAYQTSGNIAVTDEFVTRFLDFAQGFGTLIQSGDKKAESIIRDTTQFIKQKNHNQIDTPLVREIKGLIRRCEARATCRFVGIPDENIHFLNLPFYETGTVEKNPPSQKDKDITSELLQKIKPHQVFAAGDFADPHGTHLTCYKVLLDSLKQLKFAQEAWTKDCWLWLYKGAWQEWDIEEIQMAIPMSPEQVLKKRHGIFIHQSQKDMVPYQGEDIREFWQRAEVRNANTAMLYAKLGLTQYAAIEAFAKMDF